jgi:hypothetical protein
MVFYPWIKKSKSWPNTGQVMAAICTVGDINRERVTVMHNSQVDSKKKIKNCRTSGSSGKTRRDEQHFRNCHA